MRPSTVTSSIPFREIRAHASITIPLSRMRSRTSRMLSALCPCWRAIRYQSETGLPEFGGGYYSVALRSKIRQLLDCFCPVKDADGTVRSKRKIDWGVGSGSRKSVPECLESHVPALPVAQLVARKVGNTMEFLLWLTVFI